MNSEEIYNQIGRGGNSPQSQLNSTEQILRWTFEEELDTFRGNNGDAFNVDARIFTANQSLTGDEDIPRGGPSDAMNFDQSQSNLPDIPEIDETELPELLAKLDENLRRFDAIDTNICPDNAYNIYTTEVQKYDKFKVQHFRPLAPEEVVTKACCSRRCTLMLSL